MSVVVVQVPVSSLSECSYWTTEKGITAEEIQQAIDRNDLRPEPIEPLGMLDTPKPRAEHVKRIAYLVVHGWDDAIELDVGVPILNYYNDHIVIDGNHRLAAAIFRGDKTIDAYISGQITYAAELLDMPHLPELYE